MRHVIYLNKVRLDASLPAVNFSFGNVYGIAQTGVYCTFMAQSQSFDFNPNSLYQKFDVTPLEKLSILAWPEQRRFGIKTNQWFYRDAMKKIQALHKNQHVDGVISRDPGALPYLTRLKKKYRIPVFYQPHNFYADLSLQPDLNPKNAQKYQWLERRYVSRMTGILCLQPSQAILFQKYFPKARVHAAPPGVLKLYPRKSIPKDLYQIAYVGSLQLKKGVEALLDAMIQLDPKYQLILIGGRNQQEIDPVQQAIQVRNLQDRVKITGWLPFHEVTAYLEKTAVGVLPLRDTFYNQHLTAPNKLFDYLSRGIPVIASDLPGVRDFLSESEARFVPPENPDLLARAIDEICQNPKKYASISRNCMNKAKSYLWKNHAAEMLKMMENSF